MDATNGRRPEEPERVAFLEGWNTKTQGGDNTRIERALAEADPRLGSLISRVIAASGPRRFMESKAASHFDALGRSIVYQQLSKKAAATIYARCVRMLGGPLEPQRIINIPPEEFRKTGLSLLKVRYLRELSDAIISRKLDLTQLENLPDTIVVDQLTSVPGIGPWTAQMFLMFRLGRPDVLPVHDVGVERGLQLAHGLRRRAAPGYVEKAGRKWKPYRSIACLYLWAAVDLWPAR